jgi:hypothetical protein
MAASGYNLQTLAYIQTIENLFKNLRRSESEEESTFLSDFIATQLLLTHTYGMSYLNIIWNGEATTHPVELVINRKTLIKSLDVSFHRQYRKLCDSFKKARDVFLPIAPGIEERFSIPSIQHLVYLYNKKSEMLQKFLYRNYDLSILIDQIVRE